jgi:hypothetical protein
VGGGVGIEAIEAPDLIWANTSAGDVGMGLGVEKGGREGDGDTPLLNDCTPKPGLNAVGSGGGGVS